MTLFPGFWSVSNSVTFAEFVTLPIASGVAVIRIVAPAPTASDPILHTALLPLWENVPCDTVTPNTVAFDDDSVLLSVTWLAAALPLFVTFKLNVTNSPTDTGLGATPPLVTTRSGRGWARQHAAPVRI